MGLIAEASDMELEQYRQAIVTEQERRRTLATGADQMDKLVRDMLAASGQVEGGEWVQPTGAMDSYPAGWTVTFDGKTWVSLTPANVWEPGVSGWREVVEEGDIPEWVQPTGAHDAYGKGDQVSFGGLVYESLVDGNTWSPTVAPSVWEKQ